MCPCGSRKKKRAVLMMVTVVALFVVCWAPFHAVHMALEYSECSPLSREGSAALLPAGSHDEPLMLVAFPLGNQVSDVSWFQGHPTLHGR